MKVSVARIVNSVSLALALGFYMPALAQNPNPPDVFDLSKVKLQIVDATFVTKLDSEKAHFSESKPDQYHGLIVTVLVTKAIGEEVTLTCQDIALHYRYGNGSDVARCYGLSNYSIQQDVDRSLALYSQGWGQSTTGPATTNSGTAYIDLFFQNMEPNTSDLYLFIAQPTGAHFISQGWKKN